MLAARSLLACSLLACSLVSASPRPPPPASPPLSFQSNPTQPTVAVGESYQLSFDTYQAQYTQDAGGATLDRAALEAVPGVKVRGQGCPGLAALCTG